MRVLVTGGTGFVGSHTVAALVHAGHEVRLLVRDPVRVPPTLDPLGVACHEVVTGDVTERASVAAAVAGCEAVVHAASIYSLDPRRGAEMRTTNTAGTRNVVEAAAAAGLDPIVHVGSLVALIPASRSSGLIRR